MVDITHPPNGYTVDTDAVCHACGAFTAWHDEGLGSWVCPECYDWWHLLQDHRSRGVPFLLAIVGSSDYGRLDRVFDLIGAVLPPDTVILIAGHGKVDRAASVNARRRGMKTVVFHPEWFWRGKPDGFDGSFCHMPIVESADAVVAFWDGNSKGTERVLIRALAEGKPVRILSQDRQPIPHHAD